MGFIWPRQEEEAIQAYNKSNIVLKIQAPGIAKEMHWRILESMTTVQGIWKSH